jgi:hypothetical protein
VRYFTCRFLKEFSPQKNSIFKAHFACTTLQLTHAHVQRKSENERTSENTSSAA